MPPSPLPGATWLETPPGKPAPLQPLSQWLELMLAEITRKRTDLEEARAEELRRASER